MTNLNSGKNATFHFTSTLKNVKILNKNYSCPYKSGRRRFCRDKEVHCMAAHPLCGPFNQRGL